VNRGKETREKERVSARLRVQREERGAAGYERERERERERQGKRGDEATRRGEDQCAREEGALLTRRLKILFVEKVG
jgi:hypothetical protein